MTQQCTLHALSWQLDGHLKRKHRLTFASLHMHFTCPEPSGNGAADTRISGLYLNRYTCMRTCRVGVGTLIRGLFCLRRCYSLLHIDRSLSSLAESRAVALCAGYYISVHMGVGENLLAYI